MNREFLKLLFRKDEHLNVCNDIKHTRTTDANTCYGTYQYFSLNPLEPNSTRADRNVKKYRNLLIEMDNIPLREQVEIVSQCQVPPTTIVFSGNKSYHFIWSLEVPFSSEQDYRWYWEGLKNKVNAIAGKKVVDVACKNPSRLSRYPGFKRSNGKSQDVLRLGNRAKSTSFTLMVMNYVPEMKEERPKFKLVNGDGRVKYSLTGAVAELLTNDIVDGRKQLLYRCGCELKEKGTDMDTAIEFIAEHSDLDFSVVYHQIQSAYRYS